MRLFLGSSSPIGKDINDQPVYCFTSYIGSDKPENVGEQFMWELTKHEAAFLRHSPEFFQAHLENKLKILKDGTGG